MPTELRLRLPGSGRNISARCVDCPSWDSCTSRAEILQDALVLLNRTSTDVLAAYLPVLAKYAGPPRPVLLPHSPAAEPVARPETA